MDVPEELESLTVVPEVAHVEATVVLSAVLCDGTIVDGLMSEGGSFTIAGDALGNEDFTLHVIVTAEDNETSETYTVFAKRQPVYDVPSILWNFVEQDDLAGSLLDGKGHDCSGTKAARPTASVEGSTRGPLVVSRF